MTQAGGPRPRRSFELERFLRASLVSVVPRDHRQSDRAFRRRRVVAAVTAVVGAGLLGYCLSLQPGDQRFYYATFGLAAVWALGAFASGPLHLGWANTRSGERHARPVVQPIAVGLFFVGVFTLGALLVARVPVLASAIDDLLDHARYASLWLLAVITLVNGIAEELFFRGAVYAAIGRRHPVVWSTVLYALATLASGNGMLVFAAVVLGLVVGLQRRVTGGVLAPIITHVTWSTSMLLVLPPLFVALAS
ncbi:MAG: CPBP family intramembrane glutamic endopeptidase [Dermatophilaceae bacterium]